MEEIPLKGWLWSMFKEYVRKIRRTASTGAPEVSVMKEKYQEIFPKASIKILVEEKVGMIVIFNELEERQTSELTGLLDEPALLAYLEKHYGRGKYKINLYDGLTFVATRNFRVRLEEESVKEVWRDIVAKNKAKEAAAAGSRWG
ncbi:MAG: hypothetical protein VST69_01225 [Nitrospirota bacterium]|nr:hypothetical protein [Nitrospirota bacterium]NOY84635.1 hypothetical protein [Candidatus Manganitrophaceae bacterium]